MLELFNFEFMQKALLVGLIISLITPYVGSFVVLKRYALIADTLAHISLLGVAIGIYFDTYPLYISIITTLFCAFLIEYLRSYKDIYSDSILAIFLSASLAFAIIIISLAKEQNSSLMTYLFGSILSIKTEDIIVISLFGLFTISFLLYNHSNLFSIAFDEDVAKVSGVRVDFLNFMLLFIVGLLVALSIRIIGTLLIGAMLIIPFISALRYKRGFKHSIILATIFSCISFLFGIVISYYLSIPTGPSIVVISLLIFIISILINRK